MTDVLVTGGAGYLGGHVVDLLAERGHRVLVLDPLLYGNHVIEGLAGRRNVTWVRGSVDNPVTLGRAVREVEVVIHLAALVGEPACSARPRQAFVTNHLSIFPLSLLARFARARQLIFTSSCSVYERTPTDSLPLTEAATVAPHSAYARTRLTSERILLRQAAVPVTVLRLSTLCGWSWRMRFDLVANQMTLDACRDGCIQVVGGHRYRPLLHVRDAARAILATMEAPPARVRHEVFNVGGASHNRTLGDLAAMVAAAVPGARIERTAAHVDQNGYAEDFAKIADRLGFRPEYSLDASVAEVRDKITERTGNDWSQHGYYNTTPLAARQ
jgi:nucleoside-diphosphate-sugar epimerase